MDKQTPTQIATQSMKGCIGFDFEKEGKKVFDYDIYDCPEELKGQLKLGEFYG
jgi:hypothetical protein